MGGENILKKRCLFLIILICFFAVSVVSAENNSTSDIVSVSNDVNSLEASSNMNSNTNDTDTLKVSNDEILCAGNNWYVNVSKSSGDGKTPDTAFKTLNEAINSASDGDTINIASGTYTGKNNTNLTIDKKLNFEKYGYGEAIFDAHRLSRIWTVNASSINITGLTFKNGKNSTTKYEGGGAIYIRNSLTNSNINATFINNVGNIGGAIYINDGFSGNLNSIFVNNTAEDNGGAIYINDGFSGNLNSIFVNNTAEYDGGAICIQDVLGDITGYFINNTAKYSGGGISIFRNVFGSLNGTFINNKANFGGAIYIDKADWGSRLNGTFINNTANGGGAIYIYTKLCGNLNGTFINNKANFGGAISIRHGSLYGSLNGYYINNTAEGSGGAIYFAESIYGSLNGYYINNTAGENGGAIYMDESLFGSLNGYFANNTAEGSGGAIHLSSDSFYGSLNATFINNTAKKDGGAIYIYKFSSKYDAEARLNGYFANNTAEGSGGAIYFANSIYGSLNATFINNTAGYTGGAININGTVSGSLNATFINNTAKDGGAINIHGINGCLNATFINNTADYTGGAAYIYSDGVSGSLNATFINNTAKDGGAIFINGEISGNLIGSFINNQAKKDAGAIFINGNIYGNITGSFINNKAEGRYSSGGAINIYSGVVSGSLSGTFINNTASDTGGAIFINGGISGSLNGTFINNTAKDGGAVYIYKSVSGSLNGTFINNTANNGGAIAILRGSFSGSLNATFINNTAKDSGGAIHIKGDISGNVYSYFINNQAEKNGGAIYTSNAISGNLISLFINNTAKNGGAIYILESVSDLVVIQDSIFINNVNTFSTNSINIATINCWFGNNATNYKIKPINQENIKIDNWLFLNATADPAELNVGETSKIAFKLYSYNDNSKEVNPYDTLKINIILDLTQTLGELNKTTALIGEKISYAAKHRGDASVTGKFETAFYTVNLKNNGPEPIPTNITVNTTSLDLNVGDSGTIIANLTPPGAGNLLFTSNNTNIATVDVNGIVTAVAEGSTIVTVSFPGNEQYAPAKNKTINITVKLKDASVSVNNDTLNLNVDDTFKLIATTVPTGLNVTYSSSDESIATVDSTGKVTAISKGESTITATVGGDGKYALNSTTVSVTVNEKPIPPKENLTIKATAEPITAGENATIIITGLKNATGNITVTTNNKTYTSPINNSKAKVTVPDLTESVTAIVSYAGDDKYNPTSTTVNITVNPKPKENLTIEATAEPITAGENATIIITGLKNATGNITVTIKDKTYMAPIEDSESNIIVPGLIESVTGIVNYLGDDKYNPASTTINITVNPKSDVVVVADNVTKYYSGSERFVVKVYDCELNPIANKTVNITINGVTYTKSTDENGTTSIPLGLNSGQYNVITKVDNTIVNSVVTILSTVEGSDVVKMYRNTTQYHVTLLDSQGKYLADGTPVRFNINGVFYNHVVNGNKGQATLNINLPQGKYIITTINSITGEMCANNITVLSNIVENNDITKYYKNATQYTVKIITSDGKVASIGEVVTFNINGVFYNRTTDASGIATLNINLPPNNYVITADYKGCKVSNNITVLPVLNATDLKMKYGDGSKFKANLVDGQGKPYADQTIQFNINGIFYNKVTDSNGQAALNINLPQGEYIITSTYNGLNVANKVTITS